MQLTMVAPGASSGRRRGLWPTSGIAAAVLAAAAMAAGPVLAQAPSTAPIAAVPAGPQAVQPVLSEGVATVVNNEIISTYDLRQRILLLIISSGVRPTEDALPALQQEALRDLIDESLQLQEIQRLETSRHITIQPSNEEVDEEISQLAAQNNLTAPQLLASLSSAGVDPSALRHQVRAESAWRRYVGGAFGSQVQVSDQEVDAALQRFEIAAAKAQYLIAEIMIDSQRAGGQEAAMEGARQLITQIRQGAPFPAVARQFSSAATAAAGGDAGWVVSGDIPLPVEEALEQLRPGELSEPIAVPGGAYIALLRDKRSGAEATLVDLKQAAIRLPAAPSEADIASASQKLQGLRSKITGCDAFEREAGTVDGVVAGSLGEADIKDLSQNFRDAVSGLQPGQVSAPVRSEAGLHIIALCGRRAAGGAVPTRAAVRDRLVEQELAMISRRELRDLRNSANIENR